MGDESRHDWDRLPDTPSYVPDAQKRSDVHQCRRCSQLCLSEVGGLPVEDGMGSLLEDCDMAIARRVMES